MKNKKLFGKGLAVAICSVITFSTPALAAEVGEAAQTDVQEQTVQFDSETEEALNNEEVIIERTETNGVQEVRKFTPIGRLGAIVRCTGLGFYGKEDVVITFRKDEWHSGPGIATVLSVNGINIDGKDVPSEIIVDSETNEIQVICRVSDIESAGLEKGKYYPIKADITWLYDDNEFPDYLDEQCDYDRGDRLVYYPDEREFEEGTCTITGTGLDFDGTEDVVITIMAPTYLRGVHADYISYSAQIPHEIEEIVDDMGERIGARFTYKKEDMELSGIKKGSRLKFVYFSDVTIMNGELTNGSIRETNAIDVNFYVDKLEDTVNGELILTEDNTIITLNTMQSLVAMNETQDILIKTANGIVYIFPEGTMQMVDGKENYDLGAELLTDFTKVPNAPFTAEEFAFRVNYNYSGRLPASAQISIPVDEKWNGQILYYYEILSNGEFKYTAEAAVTDGVYTVTQDHCSDYVATTKAPEKEEEKPITPENNKPDNNSTADNSKPDDNKPSTPDNGKTNDNKPSTPNHNNQTSNVEKESADTSPKTGDANEMALYLALGMSSIGGLGYSVRRKFFK